MICRICGVTGDNLVPLHDGRFLCTDCDLKWLESYRNFAEFWLKFKTTSEHGIEINSKILKDTEKEIKKYKKNEQPERPADIRNSVGRGGKGKAGNDYRPAGKGSW